MSLTIFSETILKEQTRARVLKWLSVTAQGLCSSNPIALPPPTPASGDTNSNPSPTTTTTNPPKLVKSRIRTRTSYTPPASWQYDVFLSFRGLDTRHTFTDHLYHTLLDRKIKTFRDENSIPTGESITKEIEKAIEGSRFSIVVLSEGFANSKYCLEELAKITKCMNKYGHKIFPVFYHVKADDVSKENGVYDEALVEHQKKFKPYKINMWRSALRRVTAKPGMRVRIDRSEGLAVRKIADKILREKSKIDNNEFANLNSNENDSENQCLYSLSRPPFGILTECITKIKKTEQLEIEYSEESAIITERTNDCVKEVRVPEDCRSRSWGRGVESSSSPITPISQSTKVRASSVGEIEEVDEPSSPPVHEKSKVDNGGGKWANLFAHNKERAQGCSLRYIPPAESNGKRVARFSTSEILGGVTQWQNALVGRVYGMVPQFSLIESFVVNRWKHLGLVSVHLVKENVFLFNFATKEAQLQVLNGGPYMFSQRPLLLKEWKPLMQMDLNELQRMPVWVQLPLLPWELWTSEILSRIGSLLGTPLFSDQYTIKQEKLGFARILVEMELEGAFPDEVVLENEMGRQIVQKVVYEWKPIFCSVCPGDCHRATQCPNVIGNVNQVW